MDELINIASLSGIYNETTTDLTSSEVKVRLVKGLSIVKSADKSEWTDGQLTYTITIINDTDLPYQSPIITDYIDASLATLVEGSIIINQIPATPSQTSFFNHTLKITLDTIEPHSRTVVEFKVVQI